MISALITAGIDAGYLVNSRLAKVHWQAGDRLLPGQQVTVAGESALWVDPAEIPSATDVSGLGRALAAGRRGNLHELMACTAAYSGLRWGELAALAIGQVSQARREIYVNRKVVEVCGHLYIEAPKNRKFRRTIYPRLTPGGYPLAERLAARIEQAQAEQQMLRWYRGELGPSIRLCQLPPSGAASSRARHRSTCPAPAGRADSRIAAKAAVLTNRELQARTPVE